MATRVVRVSSVAGARLLYPVIAFLVSLAILAAVPVMLANLDKARRYVDPAVRQVMIGAGALAAVAVCLFVVMHLAIAVRLVAVLYAVQRGERVWIATPTGLLGSPRGRLELQEGVVGVQVVMRGDPQAAARSNFTHHLYVSQEGCGRTLHMATMGFLGPEAVTPLVQWAQKRGIDVRVFWLPDVPY